MNNLEGYTTNGHEYRKSEIDRSNTRRLKWMMDEAKKNVEKQDDKNSNDVNKNNSFVEKKEVDSIPKNRNMFNPNINSFAKFNKNNFK